MTTVEVAGMEGLAQATSQLSAALGRVLVGIRSSTGSGSGTIWEREGNRVVTNAHVADAGEVVVTLPDGREVVGRVTAADRTRDLAAVKVDALLPAAAIAGAAARLRPGHLVFAAGNPWGQRGTITSGVVVAGPTKGSSGRAARSVVLADLRLGPGSSGGPLADAGGRVVGINSMVSGGMAVAVPVEDVVAFMADGRDERGFLGIDLAPIGEVGKGSARLLITGIHRGSAAEAAGFLPGDILVDVNAGSGGGHDPLARRLEAMRVGKPIRVTLLRGGRREELLVTPGARAG